MGNRVHGESFGWMESICPLPDLDPPSTSMVTTRVRIDPLHPHQIAACAVGEADL